MHDFFGIGSNVVPTLPWHYVATVRTCRGLINAEWPAGVGAPNESKQATHLENVDMCVTPHITSGKLSLQCNHKVFAADVEVIKSCCNEIQGQTWMKL